MSVQIIRITPYQTPSATIGTKSDGSDWQTVPGTTRYSVEALDQLGRPHAADFDHSPTSDEIIASMPVVSVLQPTGVGLSKRQLEPYLRACVEDWYMSRQFLAYVATRAGATTLAAAITSTTATSISVASATGFPQSGVYPIVVDSEVMFVTGGQGTTTWTVTRGANGSTAATHLNGAAVTGDMTAQQVSDAVGFATRLQEMAVAAFKAWDVAT